jgi:hypothetical protein
VRLRFPFLLPPGKKEKRERGANPMAALMDYDRRPDKRGRIAYEESFVRGYEVRLFIPLFCPFLWLVRLETCKLRSLFRINVLYSSVRVFGQTMVHMFVSAFPRTHTFPFFLISLNPSYSEKGLIL